MSKRIARAILASLPVVFLASPGFAQSDSSAIIQKDGGCMLPGSLVGVTGVLLSTDTESIVVANSGGITKLKCHFDIPPGREPSQTTHAKGFNCRVYDGTTTVITTDSRASATPGGRAHLTCKYTAD